MKTVTELLDKFKTDSCKDPPKKGSHELSQILKGTLRTDLYSLGTGVMSRAQRKKLVGLILSHYHEDNDVENIFISKDDIKFKERKDGGEFDDPKKKESQAWKDNDSCLLVKDTGQHRVRSRWVLTRRRVFTKQQLVKLLNKEVNIKGVPMVVKLKARLTPQGTHNQDLDRENIECESPTENKLNIRI